MMVENMRMMLAVNAGRMSESAEAMVANNFAVVATPVDMCSEIEVMVASN